MNEEVQTDQPPLYDRELSWLSFNYRVLQEAADERVPLIERLRFLAIYSSNLDEFYTVRVAGLHSLTKLKKKTKKKLEFSPKKLVREINDRVVAQLNEYGKIFREQLVPGLEHHRIVILNDEDLSPAQLKKAQDYFEAKVRPHLEFWNLKEGEEEPFLNNREEYLVVDMVHQDQPDVPVYACIRVPSHELSRFCVLPNEDCHCVMFLDDVVRVSLPMIFPEHTVRGCHAIKMSRDADLYIDDEFTGDLVDKVRKSLSKRQTGIPCRFLYDGDINVELLEFLKRKYKLEEEDLVKGGKYHNMQDYFGFPTPDIPELLYPPQPALPHAGFDQHDSMFSAIAEKDRMIHVPYQTYDYMVRFLEEAADDPKVSSIKITLYRVAKKSLIAKALIRALKNGVEVEVFDEVKARFDEQTNIFWGDALQEAGATVRYSYPDLKVHSKVCLVKRKEGDRNQYYAYLGTGNFNESSARIYCDHGLFTTHAAMTEEVDRVFKFLIKFKLNPKFKHLLVSPFQMRERFEELIDVEIEQAQKGEKARIMAKMNSLEDTEMIKKLYAASQAGVQIDLIVRGICRLVPGVPGWSENIRVISIVDRYLEHARVYAFYNGGDERLFMASADWMSRNLNRRVEVGFPIYDQEIIEEVKQIIELQLCDSSKARVINAEQDNTYVESTSSGDKAIEAQRDAYQYLREKHQVASPTP